MTKSKVKVQKFCQKLDFGGDRAQEAGLFLKNCMFQQFFESGGRLLT
jgi:hypothetical protein